MLSNKLTIKVDGGASISNITPLDKRGNVARSGNFGYEMDLTKFNLQEKEQAKKRSVY